MGGRLLRSTLGRPERAHKARHPKSEQDTKRVGRRVLPLANPVAQQVLQRLDQHPVREQQRGQAELVGAGVGQEGRQRERAVAQGVLLLVPQAKDLERGQVGRGHEGKGRQAGQ